MSATTVLYLFTQAATVLALVAAPVLIVSLAIGLVVSVLQAITQLNESTLSYVPKIAAVAIVLAVLGPWMLQTLIDYTVNLFASMATLVHGA